MIAAQIVNVNVDQRKGRLCQAWDFFPSTERYKPKPKTQPWEQQLTMAKMVAEAWGGGDWGKVSEEEFLAIQAELRGERQN